MSGERTCCVCKKPVDDRHRHIIKPCGAEGGPLAFIISLQRYYDDTAVISRQLGLARQELKEFFPDKEFEIQPARLMLLKDGENDVFLGEAYVATYAVFEK